MRPPPFSTPLHAHKNTITLCKDLYISLGSLSSWLAGVQDGLSAAAQLALDTCAATLGSAPPPTHAASACAAAALKLLASLGPILPLADVLKGLAAGPLAAALALPCCAAHAMAVIAVTPPTPPVSPGDSLLTAVLKTGLAGPWPLQHEAVSAIAAVVRTLLNQQQRGLIPAILPQGLAVTRPGDPETPLTQIFKSYVNQCAEPGVVDRAASAARAAAQARSQQQQQRALGSAFAPTGAAGQQQGAAVQQALGALRAAAGAVQNVPLQQGPIGGFSTQQGGGFGQQAPLADIGNQQGMVGVVVCQQQQSELHKLVSAVQVSTVIRIWCG